MVSYNFKFFIFVSIGMILNLTPNLVISQVYRNVKMNRQSTYIKPIVETASGKYIGKIVTLGSKQSAVAQFLGIPYAQTITPKSRWQLPEKREPCTDTIDATSFGPVCPQSRSLKDPLIPIWLKSDCQRVKNMMINMSEDCLYLNIYVPGKYFKDNTTTFSSLKLPVMLYFHGHTFNDGAGSLYDGSVLSNHGDVIVVTFNYRLGVLGFMSSGSNVLQGNFGLYDQLQANDWVLQNIPNFGGDKNKVTAFGSGAGGASIGLLMLSPHAEGKGENVSESSTVSEGKFKRAILQSGSPLSSWAFEEQPEKSFYSFVNSSKINCYKNTTQRIIECLKTKHWSVLVNAVPSDLEEPWRFLPVVDHDLLTRTPRRLMEQKEFINYEVMIGVTSDNGFGYAQRRLRLVLNESCNMANGFNEEGIYKQENYIGDVVNFVSKYFNSTNYSDVICHIIGFTYTQWNKQLSNYSWMKSLIDLYTDLEIVLPAIQTAEIHSYGANPTYFYTFDQNPGKSPSRSWLGAVHGEELPYIFGAPFVDNGKNWYPYIFDQDDKMLSDALITYWANFAKNGNPNNGESQNTDFYTGTPNAFQNIKWPRYDNDTKEYLQVLYKPQIKNYYRRDKMAFWRSFIPTLRKNKEPEKECLQPSQNPVTEKSKAQSNSFNREATTPSCQEKTKVDSLCKIVAISIAVFFFCISAIIFALMSYQKDKHRFQLEKLRTDLKGSQKREKTEIEKPHLENKKKIIDEKSPQPNKKLSTSSGAPLPAAPMDHVRTLPMKSCLKVGGSKVPAGPDLCKVRVTQVATSPSNLSGQATFGHANTMRSQVISTERFAELEGIRCITLGRRRCNSALASTLLKQADDSIKYLTETTRQPQPPPPVHFIQSQVCNSDLLAYKPLDGSVRSLTLNRTNHRVGNGPYGSVYTTQRPQFQSQMIVGQHQQLDNDRKPLICRTKAGSLKSSFQPSINDEIRTKIS